MLCTFALNFFVRREFWETDSNTLYVLIAACQELLMHLHGSVSFLLGTALPNVAGL